MDFFYGEGQLPGHLSPQGDGGENVVFPQIFVAYLLHVRHCAGH